MGDDTEAMRLRIREVERENSLILTGVLVMTIICLLTGQAMMGELDDTRAALNQCEARHD